MRQSCRARDTIKQKRIFVLIKLIFNYFKTIVHLVGFLFIVALAMPALPWQQNNAQSCSHSLPDEYFAVRNMSKTVLLN
jgi:hypothetical protein